MKKNFFNKLLSIAIVFTLALTFNVINYSNEVQAKDKVNYTKEEKVSIKHINNSLSDDYVTTHPVPDDFDATSATDKELEYYNLPKHPTDISKLAKWKKIVSCKWVKPDLIETDINHSAYNNDTTTSSAATLNTVTSSNSNHWSGYVYNEPCASVDGDWNVPKVSTTSSYMPAAASQWVGLVPMPPLFKLVLPVVYLRLVLHLIIYGTSY